jgi:hypothetical protein
MKAVKEEIKLSDEIITNNKDKKEKIDEKDKRFKKIKTYI